MVPKHVQAPSREQGSHGVLRSGRIGSLALLLAAASAPIGASAQDVGDLDIDMPNALEDAFAGRHGDLQLLGAARVDRWRRGRGGEVRLFPRVQWVPVERLQLTAGLPYTVGWGTRSDEGEASLGALYQLNRETGALPAFAVVAEASAPVGPGDRGGELSLAGIASKTVAAGPAQPRLHLNAYWFRRLDPSSDERRDGYRLAIGHSRLLSPDTALVLDVLRESQDRGERAATILEAGLRHRPTEGVVVGAALGAGVGHDSPAFRATLSVQISLGGG
jgi:hypothetical protein